MSKVGSPEFTKTCKLYCDAMAAGKGHKEVVQSLKTKGLNYSNPVSLAWYADERNPKAVKADPNFPTEEKAAGVRIGELRAEGLSWGQITVIAGWPRLSEAKVRTLFERYVGLASSGMRIGKGGRFFQGERMLYQGNNKGLGYEDTPEKIRQVNPADVAEKSENYKTKLPTAVKKAKGTARSRVKKAAATDES